MVRSGNTSLLAMGGHPMNKLQLDYVYQKDNNFSMEKTISTSGYDVIVIRHRSGTLKSTPFQAAFSSGALKNREVWTRQKKQKLKDVHLYVNDQLIEMPMRVDPQSGRVQFQKKYTRKVGCCSDSSDVSDDDRSQRSASREKQIMGKNMPGKGQSIEELKNQAAPHKFWQFAWLFSRGKNQQIKLNSSSTIVSTNLVDESEQQGVKRLAKIKQELYQGQQSSKQPLFQLSLCGNLLLKRKDGSRQQLQKLFYDHKVQYKEFIKDPLTTISDSNLVVRIDDSLYTWQLGVAILTCRFAFGKELSKSLVDEIIKTKSKKSGWLTFFGRDNNAVTKLDIAEKQPIKLGQVNSPTRQQPEIVRYKKAPDGQMLAKMGLKDGENRARVILETGTGVEIIQFLIFLWDEDEQVVISDIDGTITKSDVMGQLRTNYIHEGVCKLYSQISKRNYKLLYLTARAIGQYGMTRKFLEKQVVEGDLRLPAGPLLMSPDGYLKSLHRQVIQKTPDQLKIKLLASLNEIFPNAKKPIFAGFGNRETDSIAYLRIKIHPDRIFCISEKSTITNESNNDFVTTYPQMLQKIDLYFPAYHKPIQEKVKDTQEQNLVRTYQQQQVNQILQAGTLKRKMSHSQFHEYERNPLEGFQRARSEEGEPLGEFELAELERLLAESGKKKYE